MKIIFMGTPIFAAHFLKYLKQDAGIEILAVVTQPDRPAGRGRTLTASPVKQLALEFELPVIQPLDLKSLEFENTLKSYGADLFVVVAYSILPKSILGLSRYGAINIHGSMLPKYRGAAPVQRAIADGLKETGITVFRLDEKMDHGPILAQKKVEISLEDTTETVLNKMVEPGCLALDEAIKQLENGLEKDSVQNHEMASGAPKIKKEEGLIDFNWTALSIHNKIRAFTPWPGGFCHLGKRLVYLRKTIPSDKNLNLRPAEIKFTDNHLYVGTGGGILEILEMQVEGKKNMSVIDFMRGVQNKEGLSFC